MDLANALKPAATGAVMVVIAETGDGRADQIVDAIPASLDIHARLDCAAASRARIGGVAEDLRLDDYDGGVIVLEDAQWADPTSIGRLQRLIRTSEEGLLLVVAHRPVQGADHWWIDQLCEAASGSAELVRAQVALDDAETTQLDGPAADVVAGALLVPGPLAVDVVSRLLSIEREEALSLCEGLVRDGILTESRSGFGPSGSSEGAVSQARVGNVAGRLAKILSEDGAEPSIIGSLLLAAGNGGAAFPLLRASAVEADNRNASGEAFHLAESALAAADAVTDIPGQEIGLLHLIAGRFLRTAGRTEWAIEHLDEATRRLEGHQLVEALTLSANLADDSQRPQDAERIVAQAEWQASNLDDTRQLGTLHTLRARSLSRIGFATEADWALDKSFNLIGSETSDEYWAALWYRAWIRFDRGEMALASSQFAHLAEQAFRQENSAAAADNLAWQSRALFANGHPDQALEAISRAQTLSTEAGLEGPVFLTQLALAEGGITYGAFEQALEASERVLDLVERQLPAWENMARCLRAQALLGIGDLKAAKEEIAAAIDACPPGANGWRWRTRCQAVETLIDYRIDGTVDGSRAEDLADLLLQSRLYGWAADELTLVGESDSRPEAAESALAIATRIGQPMLAARAATAGDLWERPEAGPTVAHLRQIQTRLPEEWSDKWTSLEHVRKGLQAPEPDDHAEDLGVATKAMDDALERAGLTGEGVLSPAQRRSRGLVPKRRVRRTAQFVAAAMAIVVVAAATAFGVIALSDDPPPTTVVATPTTAAEATATTIAPGIAGTTCEIDNGRGFLFGTASHRGDSARTGFTDVSGPREVSCLYWDSPTSGAITTTPLAFGQQLFVGTDQGTFYIFDQSNGRFRTISVGGIGSAPALGEANIPGAEDANSAPSIFVFVDRNGVAQAHKAGIAAFTSWYTDLGTTVTSAPIVFDGRVFVAGVDGVVRALSADLGVQTASWPANGSTVGSFEADLALSDGLLYAASSDGFVYVLDTNEDLAEVCRYDAGAPIQIGPVIDQGVVYVPSSEQLIWMFPAGDCDGRVSNRLSPMTMETPNIVPPAVVNGIIYLAEGPYIYAKDLNDNQADLWMPSTVDANSTITSPPVVTQDTLYFAAEDGMVYAVDSTTGELLWQFDTGLTVRGGITVVDDAVFVASENGTVYALGPTPASDG